MNKASALQHMICGAESPSGDWAYSDYQNAADAKWKESQLGTLGGMAVVTIPKNGPAILAKFTTSEDASAGYDNAVNDPGQLWYIALYDAMKAVGSEQQRIDETYLGGTQVTTTVVKTKKSPIWGWVVGIVASTGLAALIASGKKGRA